jgi:hypothetical protein
MTDKCKMFTTGATGRLYEQSSGRTEQRQEEAEMFEGGDMYVIQYLPCIPNDSFHECGRSDET